MASQRPSLALLIVGTILFGLAIALRNELNPWFSNAVLGVVVAIACLYLLRPRLPELFRPKPRVIGMALAAGLLMVAATHLGYRLACELVPALSTEVEGLYANIRPQAPPQALTVLLIAAVVLAEELLWRGVAIDLVGSKVGPFAAVAIATVLYTLPQLIGGEWVLILAALTAGAVFGMQRIVTKQLAPSIVTHFIWSASIFSLLPLEG